MVDELPKYGALRRIVRENPLPKEVERELDRALLQAGFTFANRKKIQAMFASFAFGVVTGIRQARHDSSNPAGLLVL